MDLLVIPTPRGREKQSIYRGLNHRHTKEICTYQTPLYTINTNDPLLFLLPSYLDLEFTSGGHTGPALLWPPGTPSSSEGFMGSIKTPSRHCAQEGPFMHFQLSPWLSIFIYSLPCTAQICWEMFVCVCTHMIRHTQTSDPLTGWNRAHQELTDQVQGSGRQSLADLSPQSPLLSMFLFPDLP